MSVILTNRVEREKIVVKKTTLNKITEALDDGYLQSAKRNRNETKRNQAKRNETDRNETKRRYISFRFVRFHLISFLFRFALYRYPLLTVGLVKMKS